MADMKPEVSVETLDQTHKIIHVIFTGETSKKPKTLPLSMRYN